VVLFVDECHLLWGDSLGYVWGKRSERVEVPILNEKERQTYFGGVNLLTGKPFVLPASAGNTEETLIFLKALRQAFQGRHLTLIWDGASYHRAQRIKDYLLQINGHCPGEQRAVQLFQFAPNAPEQNPMEDVWLLGKNLVRKNYHLLDSFQKIKDFFCQAVRNITLRSKKFDWYGRLHIV
jgi:transposase